MTLLKGVTAICLYMKGFIVFFCKIKWKTIIVKDIIQKYFSTHKWKWFKYVSYDILVWNNEVRIETLFWDVLWYVVTHKISCLCILFITTCAMVTPNAFPKLWSYKWRGLSESVHWILEQTMSKVWFMTSMKFCRH